MKLYRILYRSCTSGHLTDKNIEELVEKARINNKKLGLTGILLSVDDYFMQVLEGNEEDVKALYYQKIYHDRRHTRLKTLLEGPVEKRDFPEWDMGIRMLEELGGQYTDQMTGEVLKEPELVYSILKYFYVTGEMELNDFWRANQ